MCLYVRWFVCVFVYEVVSTCIFFLFNVFLLIGINYIEISTMSSSEPSPRESFFSASRHSSVCLWGGQVDSYVPVDDLDYLHEFNSATATWTKHQLQGRHPPGLHNGGCARIDDYLYFYGGLDERGRSTGSLYQLNLTSKTWKEMSPPGASGSPGVKYGCRIIDFKSSLLVHGGMYAGGVRTNDLHIFDLATGKYELS